MPYFSHINHRLSQHLEKPVVPAVESHRRNWFQNHLQSPEGKVVTKKLKKKKKKRLSLHMAPAEAELEPILFVPNSGLESDHWAFQTKTGTGYRNPCISHRMAGPRG